jgi:hypothetical protein
MDNQRKQSVIVVDWCCMCKRSWETASALWCVIFNRIGLTWVIIRRVVDISAFGESWEVVLIV